MSKKKKDKKHKLKSLERRTKQYQTLMSQVADSHFDQIENNDSKNIKKMITNDHAKISNVATTNYAKKDLIMILYLVIAFALLLGTLYYLESKYQYLSPLGNRLMEFIER